MLKKMYLHLNSEPCLVSTQLHNPSDPFCDEEFDSEELLEKHMETHN